jgi:hypothetical protein
MTSVKYCLQKFYRRCTLLWMGCSDGIIHSFIHSQTNISSGHTVWARYLQVLCICDLVLLPTILAPSPDRFLKSAYLTLGILSKPVWDVPPFASLHSPGPLDLSRTQAVGSHLSEDSRRVLVLGAVPAIPSVASFSHAHTWCPGHMNWEVSFVAVSVTLTLAQIQMSGSLGQAHNQQLDPGIRMALFLVTCCSFGGALLGYMYDLRSTSPHGGEGTCSLSQTCHQSADWKRNGTQQQGELLQLSCKLFVASPHLASEPRPLSTMWAVRTWKMSWTWTFRKVAAAVESCCYNKCVEPRKLLASLKTWACPEIFS